MRKKILLLTFSLFALNWCVNAETLCGGPRKMWASICDLNVSEGVSGVVTNSDFYKPACGKLLISWRMLPTDTFETTFYIYRRGVNSSNIMRKTSKPINATNYQEPSVLGSDFVYYLLPSDFYSRIGLTSAPMMISDNDKEAFKTVILDSVYIGPRLRTQHLPYISIPLKSTEDVSSVNVIRYQANDCSVGDLDGDGEMEVVVKRLLTVYDENGNVISGSEGAGDTDTRARHIVIWDAYKLDGTFMWRVMSGPNIIAGNSSAVTVGDLDGDGCAELVIKSSEGTVFGDGVEIPDTDGDGITDYRSIWPAGHYTGDGEKGYGGPEFFSVIDGKTGKEMARADYIARGTEGETPAQLAANWYENDWKWDPRTKKYYWKLANSLRMGLASFDGEGLQIFLGRGVYGRTVVEAWRYQPAPDGDFQGTLTRMWKFDSMDAGGRDKNKDGKLNSAYAGQGNHAFNVADLDGDGKDEVMYGSCAFDDDGTGLWTTGLGHGDANHVGRFLPDREGLQVYHCLEGGTTQVALHDAADGSLIWKKEGTSDNDMGRCLVSDVDPSSPGCEFWMYGNELFSQSGNELYDSSGARKTERSCNMAIWFDGTLSRQTIDGNIIHSYAHGRTFTIYRFDMAFNNGTKSNPGWYGDFLGDWREEVIVPTADKLTAIKIFSTWYPSDYMLPYLMSDHTYKMQTIHQNVGYNQPNHVGGYFLGTGMDFSKVPLQPEDPTSLSTVEAETDRSVSADAPVYDLSGRQVSSPKSPGIYIQGGRKFVIR